MAAVGAQPGRRDRISLPMYDQPFCRAATDRLFVAVLEAAAPTAQAIEVASIAMTRGPGGVGGSIAETALPTGDGPHRLEHRRDQSAAETVWSDPRLLMSQTCGQTLWDQHAGFVQEGKFKEALAPLASPCYTARGCDGHRYCGLIIVRDCSQFQSLGCLAGAHLAVNALGSFSGCVGLRCAVAEMLQLDPGRGVGGQGTRINFFDPNVLVTGGHRASVQAVMAGVADCASVDCVTWAMLEAECAAADAMATGGEEDGSLPRPLAINTTQLRVVGETPRAPAPPFVTAADLAGTGVADALFTALANAIAPAPLAPHRDPNAGSSPEPGPFERPLFLRAVVRADPEEYRAEFARLNALAAPIAIDDQWGSPGADEAQQFIDNLDRCGYSFGLLSAATLRDARDVVARQWINRGFLCLWAFNHDEAKACFDEAVVLLADAHSSARGNRCNVMGVVAHWAAAHARCTNYNKYIVTVAELQLARQHSAEASRLLGRARAAADPDDVDDRQTLQLHLDLLEAQQLRLAVDVGGDDVSEATFARRDVEYSGAMQHLQARHCLGVTDGNATEIAALLAESLMQLAPWKMWQEGTVDLARQTQAVIEGALGMPSLDGQGSAAAGPSVSIAPMTLTRHPGLVHFHVHLMEMASTELVHRALPSAQLLRSQWPACGHLIHMASHLDVHLGLFNRAVNANLRAIAADKVFAARRGSDNYYHTYRLHCHSQLVWSAGFAGRSRVALISAEEILTTTPASLRIECADFVEPLGALIWSAMVRFGRWEDILARPEPPAFVASGSDLNNGNYVSIAMARWAKAVAAAALGQLDAALRFQQTFRQAVAVVPPTRYIHNVPSARSLAVADRMLDGELSYRRAALQSRQPQAANVADPFAEAFSLLREAVVLDEALPYDEPWGWHTPVAHALGALLLEQGRAAEATLVYKRDLQRWPDNMWALHGLWQCLLARSPCMTGPCCSDRAAGTPGLAAEVANDAEQDPAYSLETITARLEIATANADISLEHSCFCAGLLPDDLE